MSSSEIAPTALAAQVERVLDEWRVARPDLDPTPFRLFSALAIAGRQVQEFYDVSTAQHGLSGADFFLLAELRRRGAPFQATPGELTKVLVRSSGGTTKLIDRLVAVGHITRVAHPHDRRSTLVQLTNDGRRLIDVALQDHLAAEVTLLQGLDPDDVGVVIDLLWALTSRLRAWAHPD